MNNSVVVLGWGSLIWDPREQAFDGEWHNNGPMLPIEFARISARDRLTLVRKADATRVPVLWKKMDESFSLEQSIEILRVREGCETVTPIGFVDLTSSTSRSADAEFVGLIRTWASSNGHQMVIWTDLGMRFREVTGHGFSSENAIAYLRSLPDQAAAREYIERAPLQIDTEVRRLARQELQWGIDEINE